MMPPEVDELEQAFKSFRADSAGVTMRWRTVAIIMGFFIGSGALWTTLGLVKLDDLNEHNKRPSAHRVLYESLSSQINQRFDDTTKVLEEHGSAIDAMRDSIYNDRADRLADKAADRVRSREKAKDIRNSVKTQALYNLRNHRPIDDGIDKELLY